MASTLTDTDKKSIRDKWSVEAKNYKLQEEMVKFAYCLTLPYDDHQTKKSAHLYINNFTTGELTEDCGFETPVGHWKQFVMNAMSLNFAEFADYSSFAELYSEEHDHNTNLVAGDTVWRKKNSPQVQLSRKRG